METLLNDITNEPGARRLERGRRRRPRPLLDHGGRRGKPRRGREVPRAEVQQPRLLRGHSAVVAPGAQFNTLKNITKNILKIITKVQFEKETCLNY